MVRRRFRICDAARQSHPEQPSAWGVRLVREKLAHEVTDLAIQYVSEVNAGDLRIPHFHYEAPSGRQSTTVFAPPVSQRATAGRLHAAKGAPPPPSDHTAARRARSDRSAANARDASMYMFGGKTRPRTCTWMPPGRLRRPGGRGFRPSPWHATHVLALHDRAVT